MSDPSVQCLLRNPAFTTPGFCCLWPWQRCLLSSLQLALPPARLLSSFYGLHGKFQIITFISLVSPWFGFVYFEKCFPCVTQSGLGFEIFFLHHPQMLGWPRWVDLLSNANMLPAASNPASKRPHLCSASCFHRICFCCKLKEFILFYFQLCPCVGMCMWLQLPYEYQKGMLDSLEL